jgi:hypothetical protein
MFHNKQFHHLGSQSHEQWDTKKNDFPQNLKFPYLQIGGQ